MYVIDQPRPEPTSIPGVSHATWAGSAEGLEQLSVWRQTLAPGAATPPHSHDCDEVVMCHTGNGEVHIDGVAHPIGPDKTVILRRNQLHQIFNTGDDPMETTAVFAATPVNVYLPDSARLEVPWRT